MTLRTILSTEQRYDILDRVMPYRGGTRDFYFVVSWLHELSQVINHLSGAK